MQFSAYIRMEDDPVECITLTSACFATEKCPIRLRSANASCPLECYIALQMFSIGSHLRSVFVGWSQAADLLFCRVGNYDMTLGPTHAARYLLGQPVAPHHSTTSITQEPHIFSLIVEFSSSRTSSHLWPIRLPSSDKWSDSLMFN